MAKRPQPVKWFPKNPNKYSGDPNNIWARSSWERKVFNWCDMNSAVISWSSEETVVPYLCETDRRLHRYFIDVKATFRDRQGNTKTYLIEIKPFSQTQPPNFPGRQTKRYVEDVMTFVKNQSKWKAAKKYAEERGMEFKILTERELGL